MNISLKTNSTKVNEIIFHGNMKFFDCRMFPVLLFAVNPKQDMCE